MPNTNSTADEETHYHQIQVTHTLDNPVRVSTSVHITIKPNDGCQRIIVKVSTINMASKTLFALCFLFVAASASKLASDVVYDMYATCLKDYSVSCVKPKALNWINQVAQDDVIQITEDLSIVKDPEVQVEVIDNNGVSYKIIYFDYIQEQRGVQDIFDKVDNFLSTHRLVAKMPAALQEGGPLADLVPRSLVSEDVNVPLVEARGKVKKAKKYLKKAILPFLLGLKFKIAVIAPLAFAIIALLTWKAMTLGLISLILNGAMVLFKFAKPKVFL